MHICFSDYGALWPAVMELEDCLELQLEFANRDSRELGTKTRIARATRTPCALQGARVPGGRARCPGHPFRLRRAGRARPGPRPLRSRDSRRPGAHPGQSRLRSANAQLGGRLREAREHGRRTRLAEDVLN
jgi:hypothetical protein